jgi:hypothetical protein
VGRGRDGRSGGTSALRLLPGLVPFLLAPLLASGLGGCLFLLRASLGLELSGVDPCQADPCRGKVPCRLPWWGLGPPATHSPRHSLPWTKTGPVDTHPCGRCLTKCLKGEKKSRLLSFFFFPFYFWIIFLDDFISKKGGGMEREERGKTWLLRGLRGLGPGWERGRVPRAWEK